MQQEVTKQGDLVDPRQKVISSIMQQQVITVGMDCMLGDALQLCTDSGIRHLPILDQNEQLAGVLTDRNIRSFLSPRLGTISENDSDRATLHRRVHVVMTRRVITVGSNMSVAAAARIMLDERVGCLPVVDDGRKVLGIVTTGDLLRLLAT